MKTKRVPLLLIISAVLFANACKLTTPTSTPVNTLTTTDPSTASITSPTKLATTPLPPTATLLPEATSLNASGPYVVFAGKGGIWITNPDGSFPTQISEHEIRGDC